jgi:hypothetical protein
MGENKGVNFSSIDSRNAWKFAYGIRNEGSYRLHHKGVINFLMFVLLIARQMYLGRVSRRLQLDMVGSLWKATYFNPSINYPRDNQILDEGCKESRVEN